LLGNEGNREEALNYPTTKIGSALIIKETGYKRSNCSMRWKRRILRYVGTKGRERIHMG